MIAASNASLADRVLRPVHEAEQVAVVEVAEAVHLVDHGHALADSRTMIWVASSKHRSMRDGADVEQQVAGRGRRRAAGRTAAPGTGAARPASAGPVSRSHAAALKPVTQRQVALQVPRNPTARTSPARSPAQPAHRVGAVWSRLHHATRKIAAPVSGDSTACGSAPAAPAASVVTVYPASHR